MAVRQLKEMFPDLSEDVLEAVLAAHHGHVGIAINTLLDQAQTQPQTQPEQRSNPRTITGVPSFYWVDEYPDNNNYKVTANSDDPYLSDIFKNLRTSIYDDSNNIQINSFNDDDLLSWTPDSPVHSVSQDSQDWLEQYEESRRNKTQSVSFTQTPQTNQINQSTQVNQTNQIPPRLSQTFGGPGVEVVATRGSAREFRQAMMEKGASKSSDSLDNVTASQNEKKKKLSFHGAKNFFADKLSSFDLEPRNSLKLKLGVLQATVSKDRNRFVNDRYDLDLTYITPRIIAMAFPAEGMEATYRNHLEDVAGFLDSEHPNCYIVYNLSERSYDISKLNNQVLDFGWPDHQAPPLKILFIICKSMDSWLKSENNNVSVIHCKGGKGRTGTVICSYFLYSGLCKTTEDALSHFGSKRMTDEKNGVTQPSQIRYIKYFKSIIYREIKLSSAKLKLYRINLNNMPGFGKKGKIRPFLRIYEGATLVYATATKESKESIKSYLPLNDGVITFGLDLLLSEDVMIQCFHFSSTGVQKLFRCQFFAGCVSRNLLRFEKEELDDACGNKKFPDNCFVELLFLPCDVQKGGHFLETFIPEDLNTKTGTSCYFSDPEQNAKYTF